ncbi:MAG: hypothetical protein KBT67_10425 [bacterium]|nr:hypothetical protein [Candidatus Limimorpha caballi]
MTYTNNSHITTKNDVIDFAKHLVNFHNISFHPDDDFADYFDSSNTDEISLYNRLNEECFSVCEKLGVDIYQIHYEIQYEQLQKNRN